MGKWGGGGWAIGDPSPNVKIFTSRSPSQGKGRGREAAQTNEPGTQEKNVKFCGFGWFSKRVLVNQKEQIYII